jgi:hypothetical protein
MLGHASAAMTLDVHAGLFRDDLDDVAQRLNDVLIPDVLIPCSPAIDENATDHPSGP